MKEGIDLRTLGETLQRQLATKKDYVVRSRDLDFRAIRDEVNALVPAAVERGVAPSLSREGGNVIDISGNGHLVREEWYQGYQDRLRGVLGQPTATPVPVPSPTALLVPLKRGDGVVQETYPLNSLANQQLASWLRIPSDYYKRLQQEQPSLLAENVNVLMHAQGPKSYRTVRTLEGNVRAVLSDSYEPRDNWDLLRYLIPLFYPKDRENWQTKLGDGTIMPGIVGPDGAPLSVQFPSCQVTDERLYIKIVVPGMTTTLREPVGRVGATIRWGAIIQNNEVGQGSNSVFPFWEILECTNGAFSTHLGTRKRHVGQAKGGSWLGGDGNGNGEYRSDRTKLLADQLYFLDMVDAIRITLSKDQMERITGPMVESMGVEVTGDKLGAVEKLGTMMDLSDGEQDDVLRLFIDNKDFSIYGLSQAVTQFAGTVDSYDRATELEGIGGNVITLSPDEWHVIAEAKRPVKVRAGKR